MKPFATALLLAGLALAAWNERASTTLAPAPGSAAAREDALFRRGVELAVATGQAPPRERFLDGGLELAAGRAPPWPALYAAIARRSALRDLDEDELARLEPARLARLFERASPLLGALAVLAVFLVTRRLHAGPARDAAGLLAAGLCALAPGAVLAEGAERAAPAGLETLLGCALLACAQLALRARDELDGSTGALLCGPLAGLALVAAPALAPLCAAWWGSAAAYGSPPGPGAARRVRPLALSAAGALVAIHLALGAPQALPENWPAFAPRLPADTHELLLHWPAWALLPAALIALAVAGEPRERAALLGWGALALAWAACFAADASGVRLAAGVLFALGAARVAERLAPRARPLALGAAVLLAAPGLLARRTHAFAPSSAELERRAAWSEALQRLRLDTPSSGPWNHPGAPPDAFVLCAPEVALETAAGARRATFACALPRLATPPERRARADEARALLDAAPTAASAGELARRGVRHVLLGPGDPPRAAGGLAATLAAAGDGAAPAGFARLWASQARGPDGAAASLWAVGAAAAQR